jgi:hypothetical protein
LNYVESSHVFVEFAFEMTWQTGKYRVVCHLLAMQLVQPGHKHFARIVQQLLFQLFFLLTGSVRLGLLGLLDRRSHFKQELVVHFALVFVVLFARFLLG